MADGTDVIRDGRHLTCKLLDASATNTAGPWVNVSAYKKNATVHVKLAFSWDGLVTVYGSNDPAEAGTGVVIGDSGSAGTDAIIVLNGMGMVRAVPSGRTTGNVTARYEGDK